MEEQDLTCDQVQTGDQVGQSRGATIHTPACASSRKTSPTVEIKTITEVFRDILVRYLDPKCVLTCLRFTLGVKYPAVFDASKRNRQQGMEMLLLAIDELTNQEGVAKIFMDALKISGNNFLHDVISGKEKLDDQWELKNLLLNINEDLMKVSPQALLPHLECLGNPDKEAIRSTLRNHGQTVACGELFLRLQARHPSTILELIAGLKATDHKELAKRLEDTYCDGCKGEESRGDPDGHDDDDDNGGGHGGKESDKKKRKKPDNDCDDDNIIEHGATGGRHDEGSKPQSGNISDMLQLLTLPDDSKSTDSSKDSRNTAELNGASSCSAPMSIENLKLHDYQEELAQHALAGKNTIIVAPTGSGKTRVAVAIAIRALTEQEGASLLTKKVVFVVNKVALVEQQKKAFQEFIPNVFGISGDVSSQIPLVHQLEEADVIILTAQILLNALQEKSFTLSMLRLLILDECHNTQKENAYNSIMAYYRAEKKDNPHENDLPQVVGLTASLGVKKAKSQVKAKEHVLKLCANLDAEEISKVVKCKASLERSYHRPKEETVRVDGRSDDDPFKKTLGLVMSRIEGVLQNFIEKGIDKSVPSSTLEGKILRSLRDMSSHRGTQQYEGEVTDLLEYIPVKVKDNEEARVLQDFAKFLKMYNESLYINRDARTADALNHIDSYIQSLRELRQDSQNSVKQLIVLFEQKRPAIEQIRQSSSNSNPVLNRLEQILVQEYTDKPETLAILFTKTRDSTRALQAWVQETRSLEFLNPGTLIGTGGSTGMTQTQQEQLLAMFKERRHNLVISTSVAEEGLDIQMCNLVVRYNYVTDDIGRVQARGRSRAEGGKFYLVFNQKIRKLEERERMNKGRERMMEDATESVCKMIKNKRQEYRQIISKIQREDAAERSLLQSGRAVAAKRRAAQKVYNDVKLRCKHCREFLCYTDDIRSINGQHHLVVSDTFRERIITSRPVEERAEYDELTVSEEIQCKKCNTLIGYMMVFRGHQLPLLTITYLLIELPTGMVHKKKWSETLSIFTIKDIDLEDLAERLKIKEEEVHDDVDDEKEQ